MGNGAEKCMRESEREGVKGRREGGRVRKSWRGKEGGEVQEIVKNESARASEGIQLKQGDVW